MVSGILGGTQALPCEAVGGSSRALTRTLATATATSIGSKAEAKEHEDGNGCRTTAAPSTIMSACEVCVMATHKYKCPLCELRSCSLKCYKQHIIFERHRRHTRSSNPVVGDYEADTASRQKAGAVVTVADAATNIRTPDSVRIETDCNAMPTSGGSANGNSEENCIGAPVNELCLHSRHCSDSPFLRRARNPCCPSVDCRVNIKVPYVPLSNFNDKIFARDFRLLEGAARVVEAAQRMRLGGNNDGGRRRRSINPQQLRQLCQNRRISFFYCPPSFSRRNKNMTKVTRLDYKDRTVKQTRGNRRPQNPHQESQSDETQRREGRKRLDQLQLKQSRENHAKEVDGLTIKSRREDGQNDDEKYQHVIANEQPQERPLYEKAEMKGWKGGERGREYGGRRSDGNMNNLHEYSVEEQEQPSEEEQKMMERSTETQTNQNKGKQRKISEPLNEESSHGCVETGKSDGGDSAEDAAAPKGDETQRNPTSDACNITSTGSRTDSALEIVWHVDVHFNRFDVKRSFRISEDATMRDVVSVIRSALTSRKALKGMIWRNRNDAMYVNNGRSNSAGGEDEDISKQMYRLYFSDKNSTATCAGVRKKKLPESLPVLSSTPPSSLPASSSPLSSSSSPLSSSSSSPPGMLPIPAEESCQTESDASFHLVLPFAAPEESPGLLDCSQIGNRRKGYLLPWGCTLRECLAETTVVEHPDILVVLEDERARFSLFPPPSRGGPSSRLIRRLFPNSFLASSTNRSPGARMGSGVQAMESLGGQGRDDIAISVPLTDLASKVRTSNTIPASRVTAPSASSSDSRSYAAERPTPLPSPPVEMGLSLMGSPHDGTSWRWEGAHGESSSSAEDEASVVSCNDGKSKMGWSHKGVYHGGPGKGANDNVRAFPVLQIRYSDLIGGLEQPQPQTQAEHQHHQQYRCRNQQQRLNTHRSTRNRNQQDHVPYPLVRAQQQQLQRPYDQGHPGPYSLPPPPPPPLQSQREPQEQQAPQVQQKRQQQLWRQLRQQSFPGQCQQQYQQQTQHPWRSSTSPYRQGTLPQTRQLCDLQGSKQMRQRSNQTHVCAKTGSCSGDRKRRRPHTGCNQKCVDQFYPRRNQHQV